MINKKNLLLSMVSTAIFVGGINTASASAGEYTQNNRLTVTTGATDGPNLNNGDIFVMHGAPQTGTVNVSGKADFYVGIAASPGTLSLNKGYATLYCSAAPTLTDVSGSGTLHFVNTTAATMALTVSAAVPSGIHIILDGDKWTQGGTVAIPSLELRSTVSTIAGTIGKLTLKGNGKVSA